VRDAEVDEACFFAAEYHFDGKSSVAPPLRGRIRRFFATRSALVPTARTASAESRAALAEPRECFQRPRFSSPDRCAGRA